jgi:tyrosine-specific transport protein
MRSSKIGAISIVAGTAIGAGMLGLPMAIGRLGFTNGSLVLLFMWIVAMYSAMMVLEVNLEVGEGAHFNTMALEILGRPGQFLATGSVFFLLYCLLVAYMTGMGNLISGATGLEPRLGTIIFAAISAFILYCGTNTLVTVNKFLFMTMLGAMVLSFMVLGGKLNMSNLSLGEASPSTLLIALPVLFTSFGYHGSIPSIVSFVGEDKNALVKIFLVGSAIPGVCYVLWLLLSMGSATPAQLAGMTNVDALVALTSGGSQWVQTVLSTFTLLALLTSFFGVSLGLFDLVAETFKRSNDSAGRAGTSLAVFLPPMVASLLAPNGFIAALSHAGVALAIIAIFLPCAMVWKMRSEGRSTKFRAFGGRPAIIISAICGVLIIVANYM